MADPKNAELKIELNAVDNVSDTTAAVEKSVDRYGNAVKKSEKSSAAAVKSTESTFTNFVVAASATGQLLESNIVNPLKNLLATFSQVGFTLERTARSARLGVETFGALGFAAEQTGASASSIASAMGNMESKIEQASLGSLSAMQELQRGCGMTFDQLKKLSPEERFMKVSDLIRNTASLAEKSAIAKRMFGSDELLPLLEKGSEGIRELMDEAESLGGPLSEENLQKSKELSQSLNRLKTVFDGLRDNFLTEMTDTITGFLERVKKVMQAVRTWINDHPKLTKAIALTAASLVGIITAAAAAVPVIMGVKLLLGGLVSVLSTLWPVILGLKVLLLGLVKVIFFSLVGALSALFSPFVLITTAARSPLQARKIDVSSA